MLEVAGIASHACLSGERRDRSGVVYSEKESGKEKACCQSKLKYFFLHLNLLVIGLF